VIAKFKRNSNSASELFTAAMKQALPSATESHKSILAFTSSLCGDVQRSLARCSHENWQQHLKDVRDRPMETAEMMDLIIDKNITRGEPINVQFYTRFEDCCSE
jgi:hypothetical protein